VNGFRKRSDAPGFAHQLTRFEECAVDSILCGADSLLVFEVRFDNPRSGLIGACMRADLLPLYGAGQLKFFVGPRL
jgi:hypothetical protein